MHVRKPSLAVIYSRLDLKPPHLHLCRPSTRLLVRLPKELAINLTVSTNLNSFNLIRANLGAQKKEARSNS